MAINDVVHATVSFAEFEARAHAVHFVLDLTEPLPPVQADQVQLEQVLSNLVKNGIDAMSAISGERVLVIRTRVGADGGVEIAVIDRGEGLPRRFVATPSLPLRRPNRTVSDSGWQFVGRSSRTIAAVCGRKQYSARYDLSASLYPLRQPEPLIRVVVSNRFICRTGG